MENLYIYDTSNFVNYPVGGQLTSVHNFLLFLTKKHFYFCSRVTLIGITNQADEVGKFGNVIIDGVKFRFLPVSFVDFSLSDVKSSIRLIYLKGLFKYSKLLFSERDTVHYLHTPEAYIQVRLFNPFAKVAVFSHGNFFNMIKGFRFYRDKKLLLWAFNIFLKFLLSSANLVFCLDEDSYFIYKKYNKSIIKVDNSIQIPKFNKYKSLHDPIRLIYIGRLNKAKGIDGILDALAKLQGKAILSIVGDGEEKNNLIEYSKKKKVSELVNFEGFVEPNEVCKFLLNNDILIMNSEFEGKPMSILEALSFGLPVVTTNVGGIGDITKNNFDSVYTDGLSDSIVDAISLIKDNYSSYSNNALISIKKFDYLVINDTVFYHLLNL